MSRQLRLEFPGSLWHITHRGNERRPIFADDDDRARFVEFLGKTVERFRWILTSYSLMPNHYHLTAELTDEETLSRGIQWLDGSYAHSFNWRHDRVGHVYQGRFRSILVEQETHALEVLRYVVLNPVRANIVSRPEDYVWSSHRAVLGADPAPAWLAVDRILAQFADEPELARACYRRFVEEGIGSTRCPWDDLIGQMYLGRDEWVETMRGRVEMKPRASEHPVVQRLLARPDMSRVIAVVAGAFGVSEVTIREGRGGYPRMAAAWLAYNEGAVRGEAIAAALRIRSAGRVTQLVADCESHLGESALLRGRVDACLATLRRKN
ncbi:MAG TPA: transposase [Thermoanaerobaculia bacterium]|nr:transposase [Thermoanaerobaculia bacterium]